MSQQSRTATVIMAQETDANASLAVLSRMKPVHATQTRSQRFGGTTTTPQPRLAAREKIGFLTDLFSFLGGACWQFPFQSSWTTHPLLAGIANIFNRAVRVLNNLHESI